MTTMQKWTVASVCLTALAATLTVTAALERSCSGVGYSGQVRDDSRISLANLAPKIFSRSR